MAQYRLLAKTFINGAPQDAGAIVEYDGQPGSTMQPVATTSKVEIPDDWHQQNGLQRIALARSLGAPKQRLSAAEADTWIQNELANRELAKTTAKTEKAAAPSFTDRLMQKPVPTPAAAVPSTPTPHDPPASN
jgi:hypothetical protein